MSDCTSKLGQTSIHDYQLCIFSRYLVTGFLSIVTTSQCQAAFSQELSILLAHSVDVATRLLGPARLLVASCSILLATARATSALAVASPLRSVGLNQGLDEARNLLCRPGVRSR